MKVQFISGLKNEIETILAAPKSVQHIALLTLMVGIHSLVLGIFIFIFTGLFFQIFFHAEIDNIFFVRQSGLFLVCLGLFYISPLKSLKKNHHLIIIIIVTKILAVFFLIFHAHFVAWPPIIFMAAAGDGVMALLLTLFYRKARLSLLENVPKAS
jgi:hypothetical protein